MTVLERGDGGFLLGMQRRVGWERNLGGKIGLAGKQMESGCGGIGRGLACSPVCHSSDSMISLIEMRIAWEGTGVRGAGR